MPLIVTLLIVSFIWMIFPAAMGLRGKMQDLQTARARLAEASEKVNKAAALKQELLSSAKEQSILVKYLPMIKQEEEIINSLNLIAQETGVAISELSVITPRVPLAPSGERPTNAIMTNVDYVNENADGSQLPVEVLEPVVLSNLETKLSLVGNYEKIKNVIAKINGLERSNQITDLKISEILNTEKVVTDSLQADIAMNFNYLKKITAADVNSTILQSGKFNMLPVIEQIKNNAKTSSAEIAIPPVGKANPFMP